MTVALLAGSSAFLGVGGAGLVAWTSHPMVRDKLMPFEGMLAVTTALWLGLAALVYVAVS